MPDLDRRKVREALKLSEYSAGPESSVTGAQRERRLDMLMQYFIDELPTSSSDLRISTSLIEDEIEGLLSESSKSDSPIEEFSSGFGDLPAMLEGSYETFELGFPLNISEWPLGSKISHRELIFENIEKDTWDGRFAKPARSDKEFAERFEAMPNQFEENFTYWKVEYEARDPEYAIEAIEKNLEVVLGQIIYSILPWGHSNQFSQVNVWNRPWSELRPPFVYLIRGKSGYRDYYFDDDISPRRVIEMFIDRQKRLEFQYPQIPPLDPENVIERKLIDAFRYFHAGATEPNRRRAFLDYWRAIETLCLFGNESMKQVVSRVKSVVPHYTDDVLFEDRLEEIKTKRNAYVHEQVDVVISNRDNEFLRQIFYELVPFFVINRNTGITKLKIWLENGCKSKDQLDHEIETKLKELNVLRNIRRSR